MALIDKLTAIADAIREKTGKKEALTLDEMVREISEITVGDTTIEDRIIDRGIVGEYSNDRVNVIGGYAFYVCQKLTGVKFPNVLFIGPSAFQNCVSLTRADFSKVLCFSANAFAASRRLKSLCLRNATEITELSSTGAFSSTPIASGEGYIYVPSALLESYKVATNWVKYADQFRALEDYTVDGTATGELDANKI